MPTNDGVGAIAGTECLLGPAYATGKYLHDATATADPQGGSGWLVSVNVDAQGSAALNQLAEMCYSRAPSCPSQQLALVFDGEVISAPTVNEPTLPSGLQISGDFTQSNAEQLVDAINQGG